MKRTRRHRVVVVGRIAVTSAVLGSASVVALPWILLDSARAITVDGHISRMIRLPGEGHSYVVRYRKGVWDYYSAEMHGPIATNNTRLGGGEWAVLLIKTASETSEIDEPYPGGELGEFELFASFYASGWPMRCFYSGIVLREAVGANSDETLVECGNSDWLPYAPGDVLPGPLLVNTAAFSGLWCAALISPLLAGVARRRIRVRRGRCPACNYDRTGLAVDAVCPECGLSSS